MTRGRREARPVIHTHITRSVNNKSIRSLFRSITSAVTAFKRSQYGIATLLKHLTGIFEDCWIIVDDEDSASVVFHSLDAPRFSTGIRQMSAQICPPSSTIVQGSVEKCEVVHT